MAVAVTKPSSAAISGSLILRITSAHPRRNEKRKEIFANPDRIELYDFAR